MTSYYWQYGTIAVLAVACIGFVSVAFGLNRLMRPRKPRADKYTTYECGMDPIGEGWSQTQIRYYIFAFLFVIFDVESVFLFPWAVVFEKIKRPGVVLIEMIIFIGILAIGLLYAYKKKVLDWDVRTQDVETHFKAQVEKQRLSAERSKAGALPWG
ncbi:MAG: NADH-quinone oxidoreductase subunit A [Actinomycetota bacterium]